ncbi:MAG: hypothetical protein ACRC57_03820 [Sarcina sp.]
MKFKVNLINKFMLITSISSLIVTLIYFNNIKAGYNLVLIYPVIYIILYIFSLGNIEIKKIRTPITILMFVGFQWIRFVLLPPIIAISGDLAGKSSFNPSTNNLYFAHILMLIDIWVSFFVLWYLVRKDKIKKNPKNLILKGNKVIYFLFICVGILIYIFVGIKTKMLNFIFIKPDIGERLGDIQNSFVVITRQIVLISIFLTFLLVIEWSQKKFEKNSCKKYFNITILVAIFNVLIIVGERRTAQVYTAFCSIYVLIRVYPKMSKKIIKYVGGAAIFVFVLMSIYKMSNAFVYGSYTEAIKNTNMTISGVSQTLQSYFAGPIDIAMFLEFIENNSLGVKQIFFDFSRLTIPISFFFKGEGLITSQLFNLYLYDGRQLTGHLISTTAYSYLYLGVAFSWFFTIFNIVLAYFFEKKLHDTDTLEYAYLLGYFLIRITFSFMLNTPSIINIISMMLVTAGFLFKVSIIFNKKKVWERKI